MQAVMTETELTGFLAREFPQVAGDFRIERLTADGIEVRLLVAERHLRPGGTVSGPTIFVLADVAVYLALLARIGPVALAVTTNASVDFLRSRLPIAMGFMASWPLAKRARPRACNRLSARS